MLHGQSSGSEENIEHESTCIGQKRNAKESRFEALSNKRPRVLHRSIAYATAGTEASRDRSFKLYDLICSLESEYKQTEIIQIGKISITGVDMATFISGGLLTSDILEAFVDYLKHDEGIIGK